MLSITYKKRPSGNSIKDKSLPYLRTLVYMYNSASLRRQRAHANVNACWRVWQNQTRHELRRIGRGGGELDARENACNKEFHDRIRRRLTRTPAPAQAEGHVSTTRKLALAAALETAGVKRIRVRPDARVVVNEPRVRGDVRSGRNVPAIWERVISYSLSSKYKLASTNAETPSDIARGGESCYAQPLQGWERVVCPVLPQYSV